MIMMMMRRIPANDNGMGKKLGCESLRRMEAQGWPSKAIEYCLGRISCLQDPFFQLGQNLPQPQTTILCSPYTLFMAQLKPTHFRKTSGM